MRPVIGVPGAGKVLLTGQLRGHVDRSLAPLLHPTHLSDVVGARILLRPFVFLMSLCVVLLGFPQRALCAYVPVL